jgi:uncharacterized membrane protein
MTAPHGDKIIAGYLAQLELALADTPASRRDELMGEIKDHIATARAHLESESDADVLNLLERLGDPAELASSANPDDSNTKPQVSPFASGWLDIAAVVLTPIVWPVGVILLWMSSAWSVRDKVIGTLVPPGGYFGSFFFGFAFLLSIEHGLAGGCTTYGDDAGNTYTTCWGINALPDFVRYVFFGLQVALFILWLVLPVLTGIYLAIQLRRKSASGSKPFGTVMAVQSR